MIQIFSPFSLHLISLILTHPYTHIMMITQYTHFPYFEYQYQMIPNVLITIATVFITRVTALVTIATTLDIIEISQTCSLGTKFIRKSNFEVYSSIFHPFVARKPRIMNT